MEEELPVMRVEKLHDQQGNAANCSGTIKFQGKTYVFDLHGKVTSGYTFQLKEKQ